MDTHFVLNTPFEDQAVSIRTLREIERAHIARAVEVFHWNLSRVARVLDIDRRTLYRKIERYGITRPVTKDLYVDPSGERAGSFKTVQEAVDSLDPPAPA